MISQEEIEEWSEFFGPGGDPWVAPASTWHHAARALLAEREEMLTLLRGLPDWVMTWEGPTGTGVGGIREAVAEKLREHLAAFLKGQP